VLAAGLNFHFNPGSNYYHRDFYSSPLLKASGRREYLEKAAPIRSVVEYLNRTAPGEPVFFADSSLIAGLRAPAYRNSWHQYDFRKLVEASNSARDLYKLLAARGIQHMIADFDVKDRQPSIATVLSECGDPEYTAGNFSALKLRADCGSRLSDKL
jgi:hypothetical protein